MTNYNKFYKDYSTLQELATRALLHGDDENLMVVNKFGQNLDIDQDTEEDVWSSGGVRAYPGAAELFNIASGSSDDDASPAGDGARTVYIEGLDADYNIQSEIVSLNGQSNVATANTYVNIHRMYVVTAGDSGVNAGVITATGASSSNVMAAIAVGYNQTQMSHYMVPEGYNAYLLEEVLSGYRASGTGTRTCEIMIKYKPFGAPARVTNVRGLNSNTAGIQHTAPIKYAEKSLIWYSGNAPANNTAVSVQYTLLLINKRFVK